MLSFFSWHCLFPSFWRAGLELKLALAMLELAVPQEDSSTINTFIQDLDTLACM